MTAPVVEDLWKNLSQATQARIALGRAGASLPTREVLNFSLDHARARDAVHAPFDRDKITAEARGLGFDTLLVESAAPDRAAYLRRPDWGRTLSPVSRTLLANRKHATYDLVIVAADGLSATAVHNQTQPLLAAFKPYIARAGWRIAPVVVASQARVALGDEIGELLGAHLAVVLVGERPGLSSPDSLGIYVTFDPKPGRNDGERNCISNVRNDGLKHVLAAFKLAWLVDEALKRRFTGVALKDESELLLAAEGRPAALP
jgi:ethanolamine ammonia-lyase small subunit